MTRSWTGEAHLNLRPRRPRGEITKCHRPTLLLVLKPAENKIPRDRGGEHHDSARQRVIVHVAARVVGDAVMLVPDRLGVVGGEANVEAGLVVELPHGVLHSAAG